MVWLWQKGARKEESSDGEFPWVAARIVESGSRVGMACESRDTGPDTSVEAEKDAAPPAGGATPTIVRVRGDPERWALVAGGTGTVRVNGLNLVSGIRILRHRDELMANGNTEFFSSERLAEVEPFGGSEGATYCGRCQVELVQGEGVVRCPDCRTLYHQNETRSCWTYRDGRCPFCAHPATLDGQFLWTPEGI